MNIDSVTPVDEPQLDANSAAESPGGAQQHAATSAVAKPVILVGNPNVGKSVLFKNLTNQYVTVSNFPGTTVEVVKAKANFNGRQREIIDSPGVNDLTPRSDDARVTRDLLDQNPDATLIQVADAKNLRRALLLTFQLAELNRPMILVLNLMDELEERGAAIDIDKLSDIIGVPVVATVAIKNRGTERLIEALQNASVPIVSVPQPDVSLGDYEGTRRRLERVNEILSETYTMHQPKKAPLKVRLGFWAMHPIKGVLFLSAVILSVFWFVGLFGAGTLVDTMEVGLFQHYVSPAAIQTTDFLLPFEHSHDRETVSYTIGLPVTPIHEVTLTEVSKEVVLPDYSMPSEETLGVVDGTIRFVHDFLVGEYGAVTMAISYALAIVLPIVTTFFLVFSLLEDSGYFPRMAIMVNRVFRVMGLNGKAVLPMILGLGCDTMATMTTRILETRRERIVTTMLLALAVPCSAQLGVLLAMMAMLSFTGAFVWVAIVVGVIFGVGWLTARIFPGETSEFVLEIPPMRMPQLANVLNKTWTRLNWYLKEVIPIFVLGTALLFVLDKINVLQLIARGMEPLVTGWLGLPIETANAFLVGFMRRDFGAIYILDAATGPNPLLSSHQILVAMVTITLFMPCIANFLMIGKEHGMKVAWRMAAFIFPFAFFVGGVVNWIGLWLQSS